MRIRDQLPNFGTPLVSISCISYNQESYITKCLESFLNQQVDFPVEILVHDDASTDQTAAIIRRYSENFPHIIKPILQIENQFLKGVRCMHAMFNFQRAQGQFIATCEADDYWIDENKLKRQVSFLQKNSDFTMCFHDIFIGYYNEKRNLKTASAIVWRNFQLNGFSGLYLLLQRILNKDGGFWLSRRAKGIENKNFDLTLSKVILLYRKGGRKHIPTLSILGIASILKRMPSEIFISPTGHREHILWLSMFGKLHYESRVMGQKINQKNSMTQTKILKELNAGRTNFKGIDDYLSKFIHLDIPSVSKNELKTQLQIV